MSDYINVIYSTDKIPKTDYPYRLSSYLFNNYKLQKGQKIYGAYHSTSPQLVITLSLFFRLFAPFLPPSFLLLLLPSLLPRVGKRCVQSGGKQLRACSRGHRRGCSSIDDFYKTLEERKKMSHMVHPLFKTRGVPGTHDINLIKNFFIAIKKKNFKKTKLPKFNKSIDDRMKKKSAA